MYWGQLKNNCRSKNKTNLISFVSYIKRYLKVSRQNVGTLVHITNLYYWNIALIGKDKVN